MGNCVQVTRIRESQLGNNVPETQRNTSENTKKHFGKYEEIRGVIWENILFSPRYSYTKRRKIKEYENRMNDIK